MKSRLHPGRGVAILACAASLAGTTAAVAPTAASAASTSCGNKIVKVPIEGERPNQVPVKAISVEGGVTCAEAVKVIAGALGSNLPRGWKPVAADSLEAPGGLIPQRLKKGSKVINYSIRGG